MGFFLPLVAGLLSGATAFHLIQTGVQQDTRYVQSAFRSMQKDVEQNLPVDIQDQSLFVPSPKLRDHSAFAHLYGGSPRTVSILGSTYRIPNLGARYAEAKDNWNRQLRQVAKSITGEF
ncbi:hypothetical protein BC832DRAFT_558811 [Gaertneriomyces semiglobifer]|nr:hypothetical protein BC832DRAFT_558811 [Gaertneriomyces semiglobifer]